jgi:hypothetical protein
MREEIQSKITPGSVSYAYARVTFFMKNINTGSIQTLASLKTNNNLNYQAFVVNAHVDMDWENYEYYAIADVGFDGTFSGYHPPKGGGSIQWVKIHLNHER